MKLKFDSHDNVWFTEHKGTSSKAVAQTLKERDEFIFCRDHIWQTKTSVVNMMYIFRKRKALPGTAAPNAFMRVIYMP